MGFFSGLLSLLSKLIPSFNYTPKKDDNIDVRLNKTGATTMNIDKSTNNYIVNLNLADALREYPDETKDLIRGFVQENHDKHCHTSIEVAPLPNQSNLCVLCTLSTNLLHEKG